jgi:hypothetical protein
MAINQLSTANTFQEWLTTTATLVAVANNLTDNTNGGFVANSSIFVEGTNASLNVRTLANINTLSANTANISNISLQHGSIVGNGTITMKDANIWSNIVSVNTTGNLRVGGDAHIYGNLTISGNVTLDSVGFDDLDVRGSANISNNLFVTGTSEFTGNISAGHISMTGALSGPTSITGPANNAIYSTITAAIDSSIAFAIALG